ncbi:TonB-dependent receptor [Brevundimonas sp.]|uniref:TonB-dependent receptor n=1 Tax=Brevundimonas sp. TaxID=1871086 RepID=UPI003D12FA20
MRKSLWLGAGCLLVYASAANAQVAPGQTESEAGLPDVVVTATRVETTLQRTANAVTSVDGEDLFEAGVARAQDLSKLVPGLQIEQNGSGSSIFLRGVGARVLSASSDPAVAFSVDGVFLSRPQGPSQTLFDLARVEVVKGPQGTLYGRNATGGAINVITNRPEIGATGGQAALEVGDYSAIRAMGAVDIPVSDTVALRLAGQTVYHDGYLSDGYNDEDSKALRASLLFQPNEDLSVNLSIDWANQGGQGGAPIPVGPRAAGVLTGRYVVADDPFVGPSDPRLIAFLNTVSPPSTLTGPGVGPYCPAMPFGGAAPTPGTPAVMLCANPLGINPQTNQGYMDNDFYGLNLTVDRDFGFATLTGVLGYRGTRVDSSFYADKGLQFFRNDVDQWSGELRLASNPSDDRLEWLIGAFYLSEQQDSVTRINSSNSAGSNPVPAPGSPLPRTTCAFPLGTTGLCAAQVVILQDYLQLADPDLLNETYAFFGQATLSITDRLRATGGVRFTNESKTRTNGSISNVYNRPVGVVTTYTSQGSVEYDDTSYRVGVEFDLAERSMVYANYSTAFHAGGFNLGVQAGPNAYFFQPEEVTATVIGIKNRFFDNRLQLNVEAFNLDYDNYQTQRLGRVNDGSNACSVLAIVTACPLAIRIENAATVRVRGVETDVVLEVGDNGVFNLNALYSDGKFSDFKQLNAFTGATTDYSGVALPGAADWVVSAGYEQRFPLNSGAAFVAGIATQYKSDAWMWYTREPGNFQEAHTRTDVSLAYEAASGNWTARAFVRNIENDAVLLQGSPADANAGVPYNMLNSPRTYGASLSVTF